MAKEKPSKPFTLIESNGLVRDRNRGSMTRKKYIEADVSVTGVTKIGNINASETSGLQADLLSDEQSINYLSNPMKTIHNLSYIDILPKRFFGR